MIHLFCYLKGILIYESIIYFFIIKSIYNFKKINKISNNYLNL